MSATLKERLSLFYIPLTRIFAESTAIGLTTQYAEPNDDLGILTGLLWIMGRSVGLPSKRLLKKFYKQKGLSYEEKNSFSWGQLAYPLVGTFMACSYKGKEVAYTLQQTIEQFSSTPIHEVTDSLISATPLALLWLSYSYFLHKSVDFATSVTFSFNPKRFFETVDTMYRPSSSRNQLSSLEKSLRKQSPIPVRRILSSSDFDLGSNLADFAELFFEKKIDFFDIHTKRESEQKLYFEELLKTSPKELFLYSLFSPISPQLRDYYAKKTEQEAYDTGSYDLLGVLSLYYKKNNNLKKSYELAKKSSEMFDDGNKYSSFEDHVYKLGMTASVFKPGMEKYSSSVVNFMFLDKKTTKGSAKKIKEEFTLSSILGEKTQSNPYAKAPLCFHLHISDSTFAYRLQQLPYSTLYEHAKKLLSMGEKKDVQQLFSHAWNQRSNYVEVLLSQDKVPLEPLDLSKKYPLDLYGTEYALHSSLPLVKNLGKQTQEPILDYHGNNLLGDFVYNPSKSILYKIDTANKGLGTWLFDFISLFHHEPDIYKEGDLQQVEFELLDPLREELGNDDFLSLYSSAFYLRQRSFFTAWMHQNTPLKFKTQQFLKHANEMYKLFQKEYSSPHDKYLEKKIESIYLYFQATINTDLILHP